ncbi:hypothetical protein ACN9MI_19910 [Rhodococcoides fascians]|uniref:hypothetical protein n=1 Tax=Rhodococcoides fascians TaxID=1828 RepID=UPI003CF36FCC
MVVTHKPRTLLAYLLRSTLMFVAVFALVAGNAGIAAAQDPPPDDPSFVENAATASTCSNAVGLGVAIASEIANATGVTDGAPSCLDAVGDVAAAPINAVKNVAEGAFEKAGLSFGEAGGAALKFALGWWIEIPGQNEQAFQSVLSTVGGYTYEIQLAFLIVSIILLGGKLALARSGAIRQVSEEGFRQLARATIISGSIGFFVVIGTRISDGVSSWFITSTVGDDPAKLVEAMVRITVFTGSGGIAMLFVIGLIGILGGLLMAFLLIMRMGMLVVVSAFLPIVAAAGGTRIGAGAYDRLIAWTLAFLLFKPVGAFVIGISAMLFAQSAPSQEADGGIMTAVVGALLLACTALVLPSLMKLLLPEASGGAGGLAAAAALTGAAVQIGGMAATGGASAGAGAAGGAAGGGAVEGWAPSSSSGSVPASFGVGPSGGGGGGSDSSGPSSGGSDGGGGGGGSMPSGTGAGDSGAETAGRATDAGGPAAGGGSAPDSFGSGVDGAAGRNLGNTNDDRGFQI